MTELTHWKKTRDVNFLGSWDLIIGEDNEKPKYGAMVATISSVGEQEVLDIQTNKKKKVWVIHFNECKPMILNSTNKKALELSTKTPFIQKWVGKRIKIEVDTIKAFGGMHDALRVNKLPVQDKIGCECCGKMITVEVFNHTKKSCGYGVCSVECKDSMAGEDMANETTN